MQQGAPRGVGAQAHEPNPWGASVCGCVGRSRSPWLSLSLPIRAVSANRGRAAEIELEGDAAGGMGEVAVIGCTSSGGVIVRRR